MLFVAEHPGMTKEKSVSKSHVIRAGTKFITSSSRAPHQPNFKYRGVLYPTIESIVLTTLKSTRPGSPATTYQAKRADKSVSKIFTQAFYCGTTAGGDIHAVCISADEASKLDFVPHPGRRGGPQSQRPRHAVQDHGAQGRSKPGKVEQQRCDSGSISVAPPQTAPVPPTQMMLNSRKSAIPPPYPFAPSFRRLLSSQLSVRPIKRMGCADKPGRRSSSQATTAPARRQCDSDEVRSVPLGGPA